MLAVQLFALGLAAAGAAAESAAPPQPPAPWFSRAEPSIGAGAAAMAGGDTERALELFRKARADTPDQRAIVEYDVGQALVAQALASAPTPPADPGAAPTGAPSDGPAAPPQLDKSLVDDAQAAFARARGLAHDGRLKAEAALAAGNLAAIAGEVDEAIAQYRQALRDDPTHLRAKKNLRRALEAKKQEPPQDQDGEKQPNDDKDQDQKDDKKDGDKNEQDQKDGDKEEKDEQDKKDGDKDEPDPKDSDKKDPEPAPGTPEAKKAQKKEAARRLLDALRARERPLTPLEMRGAKPVRAKEGKDW